MSQPNYEGEISRTKRPTVPAMEERLFKPIECLDHGFVRLIDYMGDDTAIVQAARVSYGAGTKSTSNDRGLLRYLIRNRHCYHPDMQVLTARGWLKWSECGVEESFIVPNPKTNTLTVEKLPTKVFEVNAEEMCCFKSSRMSYCVTSDHTMLFKGKYQTKFNKVKVQDMKKWGHFDPLYNYSFSDHIFITGYEEAFFQFIGFWHGDGTSDSVNRLNFHLKKPRKKDYLEALLEELGYAYCTSGGWNGATKYSIEFVDALRPFINPKHKAKDKGFEFDIFNLSALKMRALLDGMINSDGSINKERDAQVSYCSHSPTLLKQFELLGSLFAGDCHGGSRNNKILYRANTRTSLESRKQYHSKLENFTGKVYCTTTSTGWLIVRGAEDEFGFVCGNTSPFEMNEIKLHVKMPIFVARQWIRHRTANVNEISARYSVLNKEFYLPSPQHLAVQSKNNKQGRGATLTEEQSALVLQLLKNDALGAYDTYEKLLGDEFGLARELARMNLPVNWYTEWYWKIDLHNLLHFLSLRMDAHAQYEIRVFANAIGELVKAWLPLVWEAFQDYRFGGKFLSRLEVSLTQKLINGQTPRYLGSGLSIREWKGFKDNFQVPINPDELTPRQQEKVQDQILWELRYDGIRMEDIKISYWGLDSFYPLHCFICEIHVENGKNYTKDYYYQKSKDDEDSIHDIEDFIHDILDGETRLRKFINGRETIYNGSHVNEDCEYCDNGRHGNPEQAIVCDHCGSKGWIKKSTNNPILLIGSSYIECMPNGTYLTIDELSYSGEWTALDYWQTTEMFCDYAYDKVYGVIKPLLEQNGCVDLRKHEFDFISYPEDSKQDSYTIEKFTGMSDLEVNSFVYCEIEIEGSGRVNTALQVVKAIEKDRVLIETTYGYVIGWVSQEKILGYLKYRVL